MLKVAEREMLIYVESSERQTISEFAGGEGKRVYADRIAGGDRDYWDSRQHDVAGVVGGEGSGARCAVFE